MKLKKNDLQELKKASRQVLMAKLEEARAEIKKANIDKYKSGDLKNVRIEKVTRRTIAQLNTLIGEVKE